MIEGSGDVVSFLDDVLEKARAGEIEGVVLAYSKSDQHNAVGYAYRDNMEFAWSRLIANCDDLHQHVMSGFDG